MPSKIILKKSSVVSKVPVVADLEFGELALNYADSKLYFKKADGTTVDAFSSSAAAGTVTSASVVAANGVSGTVATATTTPAITITLGAITPSSVLAVGSVTGSNLSGTNTGDNPGVTSITAGIALSGGTITGTGTISLANTAVVAGSYTSTSITVDAQGRITSASSGTGGGVTLSDDTTTNATRYLVFEDITSGAATTMQVASTKLTFNPSTGALTATTVTASSDERLKSEWENLHDDFLKDLSEVKVGTYRHSLDSTDSRQIGVSAQSLSKNFPEAIAIDDKGYLSVAYGNIALASSVELSKRVIELEERIVRLEKLLTNS